MADIDATRLARSEISSNEDKTRLAGGAYPARLVSGAATLADDKTRLAQDGDQSRLARDVVDKQAGDSELFKIGEKIGDQYEVLAIYHGAMGVVYGCLDHETKQPRALKTVRTSHANNEEVFSLFESEAFVWVSLEEHPYIVRAYLVERFRAPPLYHSIPYVITEYVRGPEGMEGDLRGWLGHTRLTLPVAVTMALQISQGMQHAVRKVPNLVHRDLKPANILINEDGKAMVSDFGLVCSGGAGAGTPAYMSPEQWQDKEVDQRSDIYAYGCILFEMFTSHRLFHAPTEVEWERAHLESTPAKLTSFVPHLPDEIDQFVRKCLEKDQVARPQSWDEVVAFFAEWYHRLTGKAVVFDFSSLALDVKKLLEEGYSFCNLGRYEEAIQTFDMVLAVDPKSWLAWHNKGITLNDLKRYEEAIQAFDQALKIDPKAKSWQNKCRLFEDLERYDEALDAYDQALTIHPNASFAWNCKGHLLRKIYRYDEAITAYDQALAINPESLLTWQSKCKMLRDINRYDDAVLAYDQVLEIYPKSSPILRDKGELLREIKRYDEALQAYDQALAIEPNASLTWKVKSDLLLYLERYDEAIAAYDREIALSPKSLSAWYGKGEAFRGLKRYGEAIEAYDEQINVCDRLLEYRPDNVYAKQARSVAVAAREKQNS